MQLVAVGDGIPAVFAIGPQAVGVFAAGQEATGIIALGQVANGVVAIGQLSRGVVAIGQLATGVFALGQAAFGFFAAGMAAIGVVYQVGVGFGGTSGVSSKLGFWGKLHVERMFDPHARGPILQHGGLPGWRVVLATVGTVALAAAWWKITGEPLREMILDL
ncbi:hypothetical protein BZB76_0662 [Actinomadura pelletieri DSM 43383]|uniref:Uncharacterized protein n=1 Tax=Actinomadura pelletieri DSM 43383 TaxID=1120940 RepID=A0A495QYJ1_9ACTN|nr:hypothetical protein [Actinomadura pelletieri]RKS79213.1 hypothetical protein BZB76_0662 [Actinomadura pelletieri DSM 43383]